MTSPPIVLLLCPQQIRFLPCISAHLHLYNQLFVAAGSWVLAASAALQCRAVLLNCCSLCCLASSTAMSWSPNMQWACLNKGMKGPRKWLISFIRSREKAAVNTFISLRFWGGCLKWPGSTPWLRAWLFLPSFIISHGVSAALLVWTEVASPLILTAPGMHASKAGCGQ